MISTTTGGVGISAIATHQPYWVLDNDWFGESIARKFVHHTGILTRAVSWQDEVTMSVGAVEKLQRAAGANLNDCVAIVFVSPSFVPLKVACKFLDPVQARKERLHLAAQELAARLKIPSCTAYGLNWFCSGYVQALSVACTKIIPLLGLRQNQFILIVNASRISRITDYGCVQTAPLFGDMATATILSRCDSPKYPVHFRLLSSHVEKRPAAGVFFDFERRENVLCPSVNGDKAYTSDRVVFTLDGMGIADAAPRAMADAVDKALTVSSLRPEDVRFVVPHQAGTGIVRMAAMKFEQLGIRGEVINGLTSRVGNVSSCSIPYALEQTWRRLNGTIACPTAAVGTPGKPEVSQGCLLLQSTPYHREQMLVTTSENN